MPDYSLSFLLNKARGIESLTEYHASKDEYVIALGMRSHMDPKNYLTNAITMFEQARYHLKDKEHNTMAVVYEEVARATANKSLAEWCLSQLPRTMQDKFVVECLSDAYVLSPTARFKIKGTDTVYEIRLVTDWDAEPEKMFTIPEEFIAKLCVVV